MEEVYRRLEEAKIKGGLDESLLQWFQAFLVRRDRSTTSFDRNAALLVIKKRINAEIILPGLGPHA